MMTLLVAAAFCGASQAGQEKAAQFEQNLKTLEQQVEAADWSKASETADRMAQDMKAGQTCADCISYLEETRSGIQARDQGKTRTGLRRLRTHYEQHHKTPKGPSYP